MIYFMAVYIGIGALFVMETSDRVHRRIMIRQGFVRKSSFLLAAGVMVMIWPVSIVLALRSRP
jgi:hypothetical protein